MKRIFLTQLTSMAKRKNFNPKIGRGVSLRLETYHASQSKADRLGISWSEYVCNLIEADVSKKEDK
jgi:hypothetical protein